MLYAKEIFVALNQSREEEGLEVFANPRNAAGEVSRTARSKNRGEEKLSVFLYSSPGAEEPNV